MKRSPRVLIKLGGAALNAIDTMQLAAEALRRYTDLGFQVIVVHGGGPAINAELIRQGITWEFVNGQRVTSAKMMEVIEATLCGKVNRQLVRFFGSQGLSAVGLSGTDQRTLLCTQQAPALGWVGSIQSVNIAWLEQVLAMPSLPIPIVAPVGVGAGGECFNINADWAAAHIAAALKVDQLLFVTDQTGIMDEEGDIIPVVDTAGLENMIECKVVSGGMLTKVRTVLHALKNGVPSVSILNAAHAVASCPHGQLGTVCKLARKFSPPLGTGAVQENSYVAI